MSSSTRVCKNCDSAEIEVDRARGITYCAKCGDVLEENIIVSEVTIEETSGGGVNVVGQFVGANDVRSININGLQHSMRESTEVTLSNGKKLINEMASQLRLNQHCMDTAFNYYKLALRNGLTRGRKIRQVIAACLYLTCRTEGTAHMLLDLCDVIHDETCYISSLGKLAMKFANLLRITLPEIDPSIYISRFAHKLEFGDKVNAVILTASRLVQRMNRDWMATGRRPSGLCGAALLVAARMHGFHRSLDDIVKVVKIGKTTLRKRMIEFEDTPSSMLTVDEFHTIDLEEEHDPPAYTRSKKFAKIQQIEELSNIEEIEKEIIKLQENIEDALKQLHKPRGLLAKYAKMSQLEDEILGPNKDLTNIDSEIKEAEEFLTTDQINVIRSIVEENDDTNESGSRSGSRANSINWNNLGLRPSLESLGLTSSRYDDDDDDDDVDDYDENNNKSEKVEDDGDENNNSNTIDRINLDETVIVIDDAVNKATSSDKQVLNEDELDLTGIDEDEIDSMILSKNEIKTKAKLWFRANKDWLKDQKIKEEQKKKEQETKPVEIKAKKPRIRKPKTQTPVSHPYEAIERMKQEKKLSSKINYDVLKNLNKDLKRKLS